MIFTIWLFPWIAIAFTTLFTTYDITCIHMDVWLLILTHVCYGFLLRSLPHWHSWVKECKGWGSMNLILVPKRPQTYLRLEKKPKCKLTRVKCACSIVKEQEVSFIHMVLEGEIFLKLRHSFFNASYLLAICSFEDVLHHSGLIW